MNIAMITGGYSGLGAEFLRAVAEKHPEEEVPLRSVLPYFFIFLQPETVNMVRSALRRLPEKQYIRLLNV